MQLTTEEQVEALAKAMSTMPGLHGPRTTVAAPARALWARELIEKWGVSIDPDQATVEAFADPTAMGSHGPQSMRERLEAQPAEADYLRRQAADFIKEQMSDLGSQIAAADTPAKAAALREKLRTELPAHILAVADMVERADPADYVIAEGEL